MNERKRMQIISQWFTFAIMVSVLGVFSFLVLPSLARLSPVKNRMDLNEAKQINGGATFYTDQPFLEELLAKREREASDG